MTKTMYSQPMENLAAVWHGDHQDSSKTPVPAVSVVIPVRNGGGTLQDCLESLMASTYPKDRLEILVVDGESEDDTRDIADSFRESHYPLRVVNNPRHSRCAALNVGIQEAAGDIIVRIDCRNVIAPDYVARCVASLLANGADNVGGVLYAITSTTTQEAIGLAMAHPFGVGNAQFRVGKRSGFVNSVYLGCFRREVFERVGLFDDVAAVISEDSDINQRIRESGGKVYLDTGIRVGYRPREDLLSLARLYFRYGGARGGNILKHGRPTSFRQLVPPAFLLSMLTLALLSLVRALFLAPLGALVAAYGLADAGSSMQVAVRQRAPQLFYRLLAIFPIMHFSWAAGLVCRLCQGTAHSKPWGY